MATQFEAEPTKVNVSFPVDQGDGIGKPPVAGGPSVVTALTHALVFDTNDVPGIETVMTMPNAYVAPSREGCYLPLRLTKTNQQWDSQKDLVFELPSSSMSKASSVDVEPADAALSVVTVYSSTGDNSDERCDFHDAYEPLRVDPMTTSPNVWGTATLRDFGSNRGIIYLRGMAQNTSLKVVVRCGWEIQVRPGTMLSSQQRLSPASDPAAIDMYFRVSRELKDAYPASYNLFGLLGDIIAPIARGLAGAAAKSSNPVISAIGTGVSQLIGPPPTAVATTVTAPSQGQRERIQDMRAAQRSGAQLQQRAPKKKQAAKKKTTKSRK